MDAASETKPAELKKTGGEQRQTDVLKGDYMFVVLFPVVRNEATVRGGSACEGLRRRRKRGCVPSVIQTSLCVYVMYFVCVCSQQT